MKYIFVLIFSIVSVTYISAQKLNKGLIAHYLFNGDLKDNSSNRNNGIMKGGLQFGTDRFGSKCGALEFNGIDAYVSVPSSKSLNSPDDQLSVSVWFKINKTTSALKWLTVICKSDIQDELPHSPQYRFQTTIKTVSINTDFTEEFLKEVDFDTWYHYTLVYDNKNVKTYLNGSKFFEFPYSKSFTSNNMPLEIGRDMPGALEYMDGSLDDLRIYNRSLSDQEVMTIYNDQFEKTSPKPCENNQSKKPPIITIKNPTTSPHATTNTKGKIRAKIEYVNSKSNIVFKINGKETRDFSFNRRRNIFNANVGLNLGYNLFEISAMNQDGEDQESVIFNYVEVTDKNPNNKLPPPVITVIRPSKSPHHTNQEHQKIRATINHVKSKKDVTFKVNGIVSNDFKFDPSNGSFTGKILLKDQNNFFEIIASNKSGKDSKNGIIVLQSKSNPPIITVLRPIDNPHSTKKIQQEINASIENVSNKSAIEFIVNSKKSTDFSFDHSANFFKAKINLEQGYNLFEIYATNTDGKDNASGRIQLLKEDPIEKQKDIVDIKYDFEVQANQIELVCFDHQRIDGDTVSILINDLVIADKVRLEPKGKGEIRQKLNLSPNKAYVITSKAWNLGEIPPNTMTLEIYDGKKLLKRVKLESEIGKSEAIKLIYKPS